jgi:nucleoside-diphosphate-sugar epimerase
MKDVIVTGGTGFLGSYLIRRLCAGGYRVWAVVRPDSPRLSALPQMEHLRWIVCPLDDVERLRKQLPKNCGAFYHFAWDGVNREDIDSEPVHMRNLELSLGVLQCAIDLRSECFVFAGSRSEYGVQRGNYLETLECQPQVAYGRAKLAFYRQASALCRNREIRYIHPRIFSVYGYGDHPWSLINTAVRSMLQNAPMELSSCTQLWNFMEVRDTADLLACFFERANRIPPDDSSIFNVATRDIRPLREFVEEIRAAAGSCSVLHYGGYRQSEESAVSLVPNMDKVERIFHWQPKITFSAGIADLIAHLEGEDG